MSRWLAVCIEAPSVGISSSAQKDVMNDKGFRLSLWANKLPHEEGVQIQTVVANVNSHLINGGLLPQIMWAVFTTSTEKHAV